MHIVKLELEPELQNQTAGKSDFLENEAICQDFLFLAPGALANWFTRRFGSPNTSSTKKSLNINKNSQDEFLRRPLFKQNKTKNDNKSPQNTSKDGPPISPQQARDISIICIDPSDSFSNKDSLCVDTQYFALNSHEGNKGVNFSWGKEEGSGLRSFRLGEVSVPLKGTIRLFKERHGAADNISENSEKDDLIVGRVEGKVGQEFQLQPEEFATQKSQTNDSGSNTRSSSPYNFSDVGLSEEETIVGIVSIPSKLSIQEIMLFLDPFVIMPQLKGIRLIKSSLYNCPMESTRVVAFIKFQTFNSALTFYNHLNCQPFDVFEEATCYGIFVDEIQANYKQLNKTTTLYELPTCPACLVRLDGTVTGLRGEAVSDEVPLGWGLGAEAKRYSNISKRCLVCWHAQQQPAGDKFLADKLKAGIVCNICQSSEDRWSCLICGHLGCGRYKKAHARKHAEENGHMLALELGTVRVWDYLGDCYVHRLVRNQADGKIVALPETQIPSFSSDDKLKKTIDASEEIALLKMQLESQSILYQAQVDAGLKIKEQLLLQLQAAKTEALCQKTEYSRLMMLLASEENKGLKLKETLTELEPLVKEDEAIFKQLLANIKEVRCQKSEMLSKVDDLSSQLQDISFFLNAQGKIARDLPELKHGTLELVSPETPKSTANPIIEPSTYEDIPSKKASKKKGKSKKK